ncbi:hypothetical protein ZHAS_00018348 [Anopheles sinensis]|uniref:Uncharacterized protein n=1 Tax=Anopheles sinensis TaxID=74873 RepID=A0A084WHM0_ANOSI|nr:hypothetical protein ZHAS_00018348 [Anopheles sinensis]
MTLKLKCGRLWDYRPSPKSIKNNETRNPGPKADDNGWRLPEPSGWRQQPSIGFGGVSGWVNRGRRKEGRKEDRRNAKNRDILFIVPFSRVRG